jgi:hypothetical protein
VAKWISYNPNSLFPSSLQDLSDECATVGDSVAAVLETAATVLDVVKNFVAGYDDALSAVVGPLQELIASTIQQLTQTGIYMLKHAPLSSAYDTSPRRWLLDAARSLDDLYDENRPILVDSSAYVGAVALVATADSFANLLKQFRSMLRLFGMLVPTAVQIDRWPDAGEEFVVVPGVGQAPDWEAKRLADFIPELGQIAEMFIGFSRNIATAATAADLYGLFADQLRLKAQTLRQISSKVSDLMDAIAGNLVFGNIHALLIYGQGDKAWLQDQLTNSEGGPLEMQDAKNSIGVVFLATGGTSANADLLFQLLGIDIP